MRRLLLEYQVLTRVGGSEARRKYYYGLHLGVSLILITLDFLFEQSIINSVNKKY